MDNQKYKTLDKLFTHLIRYPETSFDVLSQVLKCGKSDLLQLVSNLKQMGLDISVNNQKVSILNSIDAIDTDLITSLLHQSHIHKPLNYLFSTTSTNQIANNNKTEGIYIADHQSLGKGRQEKKWITPLGQSIAISITHNFNFGLNELSGLNIAIGVAILKAAQENGIHGLGLKWPNDVMGDKGKVAGILIQVSGNKHTSHVIIGIGINWNIRKTLFQPIEQECMNMPCADVSRSSFIAQLIKHVEAMLKEFTNNKLLNILPLWNQYDLYKNQSVNILQDETQWLAKYLGINLQGLLQVEKFGQIKTIANGVVSIRKVD